MALRPRVIIQLQATSLEDANTVADELTAYLLKQGVELDQKPAIVTFPGSKFPTVSLDVFLPVKADADAFHADIAAQFDPRSDPAEDAKFDAPLRDKLLAGSRVSFHLCGHGSEPGPCTQPTREYELEAK